MAVDPKLKLNNPTILIFKKLIGISRRKMRCNNKLIALKKTKKGHFWSLMTSNRGKIPRKFNCFNLFLIVTIQEKLFKFLKIIQASRSKENANLRNLIKAVSLVAWAKKPSKSKNGLKRKCLKFN